MTTVANSTLLANVAPVFVVLGGWLLFRTRVTGTYLDRAGHRDDGCAHSLAGQPVPQRGSFLLRRPTGRADRRVLRGLPNVGRTPAKAVLDHHDHEVGDSGQCDLHGPAAFASGEDLFE